LASLCVSHVVPVRLFGIYSAAGILVSLVILFILLPTMMEKWPLAGVSQRTGPQNPIVRRAGNFVIRHRRPVVVICLAMMVFFGGGVWLVQTSMKPMNLFSQRSRWIKDARWLEDRIGPLAPIEIVVAFDKQGSRNFLEQMELVGQIERTVRVLDYVGGTTSAATFVPPSRARRGLLNRRLLRRRDYFEDMGYLEENADENLWRISARVEAFNDLDYDYILAHVADRVDAFLDDKGESRDTLHATYTGIVPLVFVAQRELLTSLFKSFCLAFVMIAVVMIALLWSIRAGMISMLPNVFPALVTFGVMGWSGALVDVGTMMTASVALGIAADDTLHFLTWFRRGMLQGRSRRGSVAMAFQRCAPAMTHTTLIAGLGLLVFALSEFKPVSQFGLLMFILLVAALVGDLMLLPALLTTRLGKCFVRQ
jgi:predicted RND superfamily exporter protein